MDTEHLQQQMSDYDVSYESIGAKAIVGKSRRQSRRARISRRAYFRLESKPVTGRRAPKRAKSREKMMRATAADCSSTLSLLPLYFLGEADAPFRTSFCIISICTTLWAAAFMRAENSRPGIARLCYACLFIFGGLEQSDLLTIYAKTQHF
ncbi:MAG TPA: hypothetical protein VFC46_16660 [Humisphaera sp.]|nr:hypothetical protein [Humisphaera sp.]